MNPHYSFLNGGRAEGPGSPSIPRARFLEFVNGEPVKVSLDYGQALCWGQSRPEDEGFAAEWIRWEHRGKDVFRIYVRAGRDCDGRHEEEHRTICSISKLRSRPVELTRGGPVERWPAWEKLSYYQRDESAERAGY